MLVSECVVVQVNDYVFNVHRDLIFNFEGVIEILENFSLRSYKEEEFFVILDGSGRVLIL